jgi:hypothetical protein
MPNDFETHALQKLLGLNQELVQPMVPDFLNAMQMMPGVSGPDEQLQAMTGLAPDIYAGLAALLSPPEVAGGGVTPPQSHNTGVVKTQQQIARPVSQATPQRPTGRTDLQQRQRDAQKMEVRRRSLETKQKKGKK